MTLIHITADHAANGELGAATPRSGSDNSEQVEAVDEFWTDAASAGIWECTPGRFPSSRNGRHEVCVILSGQATVESEDGTSVLVRAGDTLVLADGWSGHWNVHETVRKVYVNVQLVS